MGSLISGFILTNIWSFLTGIFYQFWMWIVGSSVALLAFLFSPTLRKYTVGLIAIVLLATAVWIWGYNSNHNVEVLTHTCDEFRRWLVSGPATDKALAIFKRHDLCM
jgi:hypothetical protein